MNLNAIVCRNSIGKFLRRQYFGEDLQQQYTDLQEDLIDYEKNFIKTNIDSYISALILERFLNQKTISRVMR